uniref:Uncharacterized protein n=1 Tax=Coccidioides posadasii RMSCC 3488 TaxID=454284 RepID=A0A0J6IJZ9_COCPO|nr:hypothetical protein CPAG_08549 [Coccidioides posadasii RMSCC 3488]
MWNSWRVEGRGLRMRAETGSRTILWRPSWKLLNLSSCGIFYPKDHISPGSSMASCSVSQGTKTPRNTCIMVFLIEALVFFRNLSPFGYSLLRHGVCPEASWSIAGDKTRKSSNDFDIDEDDGV